MLIKLKSSKEHNQSKGVKFLLHQNLAVSQEPRSLDILHASELTYKNVEFCPRERAFLLRNGDNRKPEFLGTALNITYQMGRVFEDLIRNVWLREYALGTWACPHCQHEHHYQTVPEICGGCNKSGDDLIYVEPRAYSEKYDTSCGIDMLMWRNNKIHVVEIKSWDKDYFRDLKAPVAEHGQRTKFYLDLLHESDWMKFDVEFNLDFAYVLYMSKSFGFKDNYEGREGLSDTYFSPFKEYTVKRGNHKDMKVVYDRALKVKKFKKTGVMPKREVCSTISCKRADACTYSKECFSEA